MFDLHFQVAQTVKNLSQSKRPVFDSWVGKIPGEEHGNPLYCSCLENSMNRGAWQATVHEPDTTE